MRCALQARCHVGTGVTVVTARATGDAKGHAEPDTIHPVWHILLVTFPFFALVLAGFWAARWRLLPLEAITGLNAFVLYFALPAMLYRFGSTTPIGRLLDGAVAGVYLLCGLVVVALTLSLTRRGRTGWNDAALGALVAAFPNSGFMGVPLLLEVLGPSSVGTVIVTLVVDMVVTSSLCVALSRLGGGERGVTAAVVRALRGVLGNPMPWAIGVGALASAFDWMLPAPLQKTTWMLADAASPVALFTIGSVLAREQMRADHPMPWRDYLPVAFIKLLVHPLLVGASVALVVRTGGAVSTSAAQALVLVAALPSASNVSLLAERLGADNGRIARIILVTTIGAFLSFSAAVSLLPVLPLSRG